jgi:hypothetical protein
MTPETERSSKPTVKARMDSALALRVEGAEGLPDPKVTLKF